MKHLSPSEFIDAADGALAPSRAAHLDACADCRAQAARLTAALERARAADAPDPSPLFWDHLSTRIREAVAAEPIEPRRLPWLKPRPALGMVDGWLELRRLMPAVAGIVAAVVIIVVALMSKPVQVPAPMTPAAMNLGAAVGWTSAEVNPDDAEVWQVLTSVASELPVQDVHDAGMHLAPAAIDTAVQRLSSDELNELGRLLQAELKRSGD